MTYEKELPDNYTQAMTVDAKSFKTAAMLNISAIIITAAIIWIEYILIKPFDYSISITISRLMIFCAAMILYIVLHELAHGAAYKLITGQKLVFGLTLSVAYCGVPNIYVYRKTAILSMLTPFIIFIPVFLIPNLFINDAWGRFLSGILLAYHIGGCSGDLYDTALYLFKFKNPKTLMRDTGPKQTFYIPNDKEV